MYLEFDAAEVRGLREYVRLVASAIGLSGPCWFVQTGPPANAYIALDDRLPLFPTRDIALLWDEEHGWALGLEGRSVDDLLVVGHLCEDVLPAPEAVASAVRGALVDAAPGGQEPPAYRRTGNDDGLLARLASYSRPLTASG